MIENIISPYADREKTRTHLNNHINLTQFALEFCHAFNVKVGVNEMARGGSLRVYTPNGFEAGVLFTNTDREGLFYVYKSELVDKQKSSKRSGRDERDGSKPANVIAAVKRNKEQPDEKALIEQQKPAMKYAVNSITYGTGRSHTISLTASEALAAVEYILGIKDGLAFAATKDALEDKYNEYQRKLETLDMSHVTQKRFMEGCHVIGIRRGNVSTSDSGPSAMYYLVGEAKFAEVNGQIQTEIQGSLKRYATLADHPELCTVAPIIRTYFQGRPNKENNDLGTPQNDAYYGDIDVASGYQNGSMTWVLIPKRGE